MSEESVPYASHYPVPDFIEPQWRAAPGSPGWYVVHCKPGQFSDFELVHYDRQQCLSEIGAPCGTPKSLMFEGAKWLGPVERP